MKKLLFLAGLVVILLGIGILRLSQTYWHKTLNLGSWKENFFSQLHQSSFNTPTPSEKITFISPQEWQEHYSKSAETLAAVFSQKGIKGGCWLGKTNRVTYLRLVATNLPRLEKGLHYHLWLETTKNNFLSIERVPFSPQEKTNQLFLKIDKQLPQPNKCLISQETELLGTYPAQVVISAVFKPLSNH